MKLQIVVLTLLIAAGIASANLGGWTEIAQTDDPDVSDAANFAVNQHNVEAGTKLTLKQVDHAEYQVVNGKNYRLTLTVTNDGKMDALSQYVAVVYVPPARSGVAVPPPMTLTSFDPKMIQSAAPSPLL